MDKLIWIICLNLPILLCGPLGRDESGMITIKDVIKVSKNMCNQLARLNVLLRSPAFKSLGVNKLIYNMVTPIPNPALVIDPTGVMRYLSIVVFNSTRVLNGLSRAKNLTRQQLETSVKDLETLNVTNCGRVESCKELFAEDPDDASDLFLSIAMSRLKPKPTSVFNNPGGAFLTVEELLRGTEYACHEIKKREPLFENPEGFLHVGNTWIPVRDKRYPLSVVRLVDPWGLRKIPQRIVSRLRNTTRDIKDSWNGFVGDLFGGTN